MTGQNEPTSTETPTEAAGRLEALVMRMRAIVALAILILLFWLPLWIALRETFGVAWRWAKDDVPSEYAKWAGAIGCVAKALITGRKCGGA